MFQLKIKGLIKRETEFGADQFFENTIKKLRELGKFIFTEYYLTVCKDQRLTLLLKFSKSSAV